MVERGAGEIEGGIYKKKRDLEFFTINWGYQTFARGNDQSGGANILPGKLFSANLRLC